jgi:hypothetical protein
MNIIEFRDGINRRCRNRACERPPAGRFAPRLSPYRKGTLNQARLDGLPV